MFTQQITSMKKAILGMVVGLIFSSCHGQHSKAMEDQKKAYKILDNVNDGRISTTAGKWTMTATINGKPWTANFMYGLKETGRIIGHYNEDFIDLPYRRDRMKTGDKIKLGSMNGVNINLTAALGLYGADNGEMVITKTDGLWVEGTFDCSATALSDTKEKLNITGGFFRVKLAQ